MFCVFRLHTDAVIFYPEYQLSINSLGGQANQWSVGAFEL